MFDHNFYDTYLLHNMSAPYKSPNRITGEGRMKPRGLDKPPKNVVKHKRKAVKAAKLSRRRNRHK